MTRIHLQEQQYLSAERDAELRELREAEQQELHSDPEYHLWLDELDAQIFVMQGQI